jgi:hypothetical protein
VDRVRLTDDHLKVEAGTNNQLEVAVDVAFCSLRDEGACADVECIVDDGEPDYSVDYEPMLDCARRAIATAGLDVDVEAAAWEAIKQYTELDSELTSHQFLGEMHKPEARAAHAAYHRPNPYRRAGRLPIVAPNIVDTSVIWRMRGRAPRLRTNHRVRGSRRSTASRGDPDLGDEPPSDSRLPIGGRR